MPKGLTKNTACTVSKCFMRTKERSQIERDYSWTGKRKQNQTVTSDASFIKVKAPDNEKSADKNTQIYQIIGSKNRSHDICRWWVNEIGKVLGYMEEKCNSKYERKWKIKRNRLSLHSPFFQREAHKTKLSRGIKPWSI